MQLYLHPVISKVSYKKNFRGSGYVLKRHGSGTLVLNGVKKVDPFLSGRGTLSDMLLSSNNLVKSLTWRSALDPPLV
jgi:hypothetical protein